MGPGLRPEGRKVRASSQPCSICSQVARGIDLLPTALAMSDARLLIASGADREYFPLLRDTVMSIRAQRRDVALGILDLGLDQEQSEWLSRRVEHVVQPAWDLDFPGRAHTADTFKAQVARPFLRRYFPGYEVYLWIDADAWLQDGRVIDLYVSAAGRDRLAITPEIDRAYKRHYKRPKPFGDRKR